MSETVFDSLSRAKARLTDRTDLGAGRILARWANDCDRVHYEAPPLHTVSLYLDGGAGSRRRGVDGAGWPGAICLIPQGSYSDWEIDAPFHFAHLYLPDEAVARFAAEVLDCDPRSLTLPDLSFVDDTGLRGAMQALLAAEGLMARDAALAEVLAAVARLSGRAARAQGGLAPGIARRLTDYLRAHVDRPVGLSELAEVAALSEFHLHRMFRARFGTSPHRWHEARRIEAAQARLSAGQGLAAVAAAGGWSSQSHMTRAFRAATGVTPGAWQKARRTGKIDFRGKRAVDSGPGAGK
ncbi:helix-turn-helix domain-containing protein [Paracoccus sp. p4-l81]|uniref:AraC family transcriptional regulator n=1 Tax=Paracoccus sp. p4-l81 TaxID=3342806 RepID=UPI0035B72CDB